MESGMPHQDKEDLRTPLDQLKEVLGPVTSADLKGVKRHGNSVIDGPAIAMLALLTFGCDQNKNRCHPPIARKRADWYAGEKSDRLVFWRVLLCLGCRELNSFMLLKSELCIAHSGAFVGLF